MHRFTIFLLVASCSSSKAPPPAGPLAEGSPAPDFSAPAHDGTTVNLQGLRGQTASQAAN